MEKDRFSPWLMLEIARIVQELPGHAEEGRQVEAVALAAIRRGLTYMPWVPELPLPQPEPPDETSSAVNSFRRR
jgi:hypothetical protein